jgi:hypothetical protein
MEKWTVLVMDRMKNIVGKLKYISAMRMNIAAQIDNAYHRNFSMNMTMFIIVSMDQTNLFGMDSVEIKTIFVGCKTQLFHMKMSHA